MSVVRVNPESVRQYATKASERFAASRTELDALVRSAVEVRYFGPNAFAFKTECGQMAAGYSTQLLADFVQIAQAVSASTGNIAASLGGAPVTISVDGSPVPVPQVPPAGDVFDVDVTALEALKPVITRHIAAVQLALGEHLSSLTATDWEGVAKTAAVQAVTTFTTMAKAKATEAETQVNALITAQIASVTAADR